MCVGGLADISSPRTSGGCTFTPRCEGRPQRGWAAMLSVLLNRCTEDGPWHGMWTGRKTVGLLACSFTSVPSTFTVQQLVSGVKSNYPTDVRLQSRLQFPGLDIDMYRNNIDVNSRVARNWFTPKRLALFLKTNYFQV